MIVCIDTNTVIQALARNRPYHPILDAWIDRRITWTVSTSILLEYQEVLIRTSGISRWQQLARLFELVEQTNGNLLRVTPSFRFNLIVADPDDNIFTDCAIAAEVDFPITEDRHFAPLEIARYRPRPILPLDFVSLLKNS